PYADDGGGGDGGGEPPSVCPTCDRYTGTLGGANDYDYQPDGNYYYAPTGQHRAYLSGPPGTDFDLRVWKWQSGSWTPVHSSLSYGSDEQVTYDGGAGYYVWRVESYSGAGAYELLLEER